MRAPQLNRSVVALLLVSLLIGTVFTGCKSHSRGQREMALLRAEILDLEDQYYSMKSRYESANRDLQTCRGVPVDGSYLGSTTFEGEYIDEGFVDGGFIEGEYLAGPIIEYDNYGQPTEVYYETPPRTGRYLPHAAETLRDSARRIFGRSNNQAQSQPVQSRQRQTLGLFNGGLGLLGRNQAAEPASNLGSDMIVVPPLDRQSRATPTRSASTPSLANASANRRDADAIFSGPLDEDQIPLNLQFDDEPTADYSPQDNVVFDDEDRSYRKETYGRDDGGSTNGLPVTRIDISSSSTRGEDIDGQPGHEGVVVLIQPKDRYGVLVREAGEVTVSLIDPSADGEEQRIGLWKFAPQEMKLFEVRDQRSEQGYLLHLPWDGQTPGSSELLLYVRYWTNDGRRLETSTRLAIDPPANGYSPDSPLIEGWTRRDPRWEKDNQAPAIQSQQSLLADDPTIPNLKNAIGGAADQAVRGRGVKATPASSSIKRPAWRPSR